MKKALFITHMLERNGAPIVLVQMMDVLARNGYSVDVISMHDGILREDLEARGISVDIIEQPAKHPDEVKERLKRYDIVICNTLITIPFVILMHGEYVPVIWWIHESRSYFEMYRNVLTKVPALSSNIKVLSVSSSVQTLVKEFCGIDTDIVPFAISEKDIEPDNRHIWRDNKLKLIMAGPLSFMKGQDIFIDALNLLPEEMVEKMQIIMCPGSDQKDEEVVSKVKAASEKYHNITVLDSVPHDEMLSLIASADFIVVNSRREPMSAVAAEAWMTGTPAILSDACGICYYAEGDMTKLIYKTGESKALSDLLKKCFEIRKDDTYDRLVQQGLKRYRAIFSPAVFEKNVLKEISMKRSLFITNALSRTGAPIVLVQMIDVFLRNGYSVDVMSPEDGPLREDIEARGISVEIMDQPTHHQEEIKARLSRYDIVICNTLMMVYFVMLMHEQNVPVLWWIHESGYCFEAYKNFLSITSALSPNIRLLSVSPLVKDLVKKYCGVDTDIVPFAVSEQQVSPDFCHIWQNDKLKLIMAGALSYQKGQDIFIDALNLLPKQMIQKMQIIMCKGTKHYEEEPEYKVRAASEKYHNITVLDSVPHDQMLSLIASADFLLVNSRQETMSAVAAEAWMTGTPAILSDACGICYYAEGDMKKLIYKTADSQALADLLKESFQIKESDKYDRLVEEGHEVYRSTFTSDAFEKNVMKEVELVSAKKALFITHMLERNGAPTVLLQMMDVMLHNGYSIDVISMQDGILREDLEKRGISIDIIEHPANSAEELKSRLGEYDIVICNTLVTVPFVTLMNDTKTPVLWWIHEVRPLFEMYKNKLAPLAGLSPNIRVLSVSPIVRSLVREYCGIDSDLLPFDVPAKQVQEDSTHLWQNGKLKLIMVGLLTYIKGQDIFVDALELLPDQMVENMQIIMCTGSDKTEDNDEPVLKKVKQAADRYHNITILGSVPHDRLLSLIASADYLLVNSRMETMSAVAAEAWTCGTPAILSDACGIAFYAEGAMQNLIYKSGDRRALADLLKKYFAKSDYDKLVEEGENTYCKNFTTEIFEQNILKEIKMVSESSKQPPKVKKGKLICMVGMSDTFDRMMCEMMKELSAIGYEIYLFDTSELNDSLSHLEPFIKTHVNAVLTINDLGFNMELIPGKNLWEQLGIHVVNILTDHPDDHQKALTAAPSNAIVLCLDMDDMEYVQQNYPQIETVGCLEPGSENNSDTWRHHADELNHDLLSGL